MTTPARSAAAAGVVFGLCVGFLLLFYGYVDPHFLVGLTAIILPAVAFGVAFGVVGAIVSPRRRQEADVSGSGASSQEGPLVRPWIPSPLSLVETSNEEDLWPLVRRSAIPKDRILAFTRNDPATLESRFGLKGARFIRLSSLGGEGSVMPGDLDRIGDLIEKHLTAQNASAVVLPNVETFQGVASLPSIRRLLEVSRDLAVQTSGSVLISLDPRALPPTAVATLEQGAVRLN